MKESWPFCDCLKGTSMGEVTLANWPLVVILVSRDNRESTGLVFLGIVCVCVFVCFPAMVLWIVSQTILSCHILLMSQVSMILTILMLKNQEVWSRKVEISWFIFLLLSPPPPVPTTMFCLWPQNTSGIWGSKGEFPLTLRCEYTSVSIQVDTKVWIPQRVGPTLHVKDVWMQDAGMVWNLWLVFHGKDHRREEETSQSGAICNYSKWEKRPVAVHKNVLIFFLIASLCGVSEYAFSFFGGVLITQTE